MYNYYFKSGHQSTVVQVTQPYRFCRVYLLLLQHELPFPLYIFFTGGRAIEKDGVGNGSG